MPYTRVVESTLLRDILSWVVPAAVFFGLWYSLVRRFADKMGGAIGGFMNIGKSRAKVCVEKDTGETFADVAGVDEAKAELQEIVAFLKDPRDYGRLGARMPKGVLRVGPPGVRRLRQLQRPGAAGHHQPAGDPRPPLLRAGRFDRQVRVDRPDKAGRMQILRVHVKKIRLAAGVDLEQVAALATGFSGADLANLCNEAALAATRRGATGVALLDFTVAIERIVAGLEKKNRVLNPREREVVAYHEMGHALVALALPGSDPVHKVSIIPRGIGALGSTIQRPTEDRSLMTREELEHKITVLLGGRAAEKLVFGHLSTGAADDLAARSAGARRARRWTRPR